MILNFVDGDAKKATEMNAHLADLHKKLFVESNPIVCKSAAKRIGLIDSDYLLQAPSRFHGQQVS